MLTAYCDFRRFAIVARRNLFIRTACECPARRHEQTQFLIHVESADFLRIVAVFGGVAIVGSTDQAPGL